MERVPGGSGALGFLWPGWFWAGPSGRKPLAGIPFWRGAWPAAANPSPPYPKPMEGHGKNVLRGPWSAPARESGRYWRGASRMGIMTRQANPQRLPGSCRRLAPKLQALIAAHGGVRISGVFGSVLHGTAANQEPMWTLLCGFSQAAPSFEQYHDLKLRPGRSAQRSGGFGHPAADFRPELRNALSREALPLAF